MMRSVKRQTGVRGFTVVELVVAIGILGVLASLVALNQGKFLPGFYLRTGARQVLADLQLVRAKAISQNNQFQVVFSTGDPSNYFVRRWDTTASPPAWVDYALYGRGAGAMTPGSPKALSLPQGILIQSTSTITFRPRGSATSDGDKYVRLNHERLEAGARKDITVSMTGLPKIS